jgi:hypothetical protein
MGQRVTAPEEKNTHIALDPTMAKVEIKEMHSHVREKKSVHQIERARCKSFIINRDCGRDALAEFKGGRREVRRKGRRLAAR